MSKLESGSSTRDRLAAAGLRPTRQRLALAALMFDRGHRHVTAEALHAEAKDAHIAVSLATVYNTLRRFIDCGLMREVLVAPGKVYFDTNMNRHHHFFFEDSGRLADIPADEIQVAKLPAAPPGATVSQVDVIVRLAAKEPDPA